MVSLLAFFSPWSRYALLALAGAGLVAGLWIWDARRIARHEAAATEACNLAWRDQLATAERDARETIRIREAAAYDAGVKAEASRAAADQQDEAKAAEIVTTIIAASPSARDCTYDAATAAALNSIRGSP